MPKYVYLYKGGRPSDTEEAGNRLRAAWMACIGGLGDSVVDGGNQFGASTSVNDSGTRAATSYTIVSAAGLDAAIEKPGRARSWASRRSICSGSRSAASSRRRSP